MVQCKNCKHYETMVPEHWSGSCSITLPRWVIVSIASNMNGYTHVRADDSCDLGEERK
jgi:hypothetical protein